MIVIISGTSETMVKNVLEGSNINGLNIIGTKEKRFLTGMVTGTHCYSKNKVKILNRIFEQGQINIIACYTDSSADIPILSLSEKKYLVNPGARCLTKFKKVFGNDFKILSWHKQCSK